MQVKNTSTDQYQAFTIRTNPGESARAVRTDGSEYMREVQPRLVHVRIPPEATVEIDDKVWKAALLTKTERQGIAMEKVPVQVGAKDNGSVAVEHITVVNGDGKMREYYPIRELVSTGILVVVDAPEVTLTLEEMRKAIEAAQGFALPKDIDLEVLTAHYNRLGL